MPRKSDADGSTGRETIGEAQKTYLITYMQCHTFFARRQITKLGPSGNKKYNDMWKHLTLKLNSIGPALKTEAQWIKTWVGLRFQARERVSKFLHFYKKTSNNVPKQNVSEQDLKITNIFGKYGTGVAVTQELGFMHVKAPLSVDAANYVSNHLPGFEDRHTDCIRVNVRPTTAQFAFLIQKNGVTVRVGSPKVL